MLFIDENGEIDRGEVADVLEMQEEDCPECGYPVEDGKCTQKARHQ